MPNNTVNFNLPYPSGSDAPCDFDTQWCEFTDAINDVIATFQAGADRAVPVIPAAMLRTNTVRNIINGNVIPFDEVVMDTAGMTDLDADPYRITITRTGRYTLAAWLNKLTSAVVNTETSLFIQGGTSDLVATILDRGAGTEYWVPTYGPVVSMSAGDQVSIFFNTGTATSQTVNAAWLSVAWHSDTEVP